ncbi:MAG: hypothetical protein V1746_01140 [bacterium]
MKKVAYAALAVFLLSPLAAPALHADSFSFGINVGDEPSAGFYYHDGPRYRYSRHHRYRHYPDGYYYRRHHPYRHRRYYREGGYYYHRY